MSSKHLGFARTIRIATVLSACVLSSTLVHAHSVVNPISGTYNMPFIMTNDGYGFYSERIDSKLYKWNGTTWAHQGTQNLTVNQAAYWGHTWGPIQTGDWLIRAYSVSTGSTIDRTFTVQ